MTAATAAVPAAASTESGAIAVRGVSKWFNTAEGTPLQVLDNINLTIAAQSVVAILGASGCGKSTLLNIISGIVTPERGEICINGITAGRFSEWRSVSYMFQEDRLLPWRTTIKNVEFALETGNMPRSERESRARDALKLVGLEAFVDAFPYQLSGGMRSRVALARSLVQEPCILLMDEPFSRLDALTRAQMHEELLQIQQLKKMTIVFVTHDVEEAVVLADRVVVMAPRPGRIRDIVEIALSRPRDATEPATARLAHDLKSLI
ncbi:MAG: ABC transporter ATP-binding protein [Burkholderiales bacterium]|jgi:ABC-type nitrate/sulfonate/bicarbonate transport system ATPase subunit|nr:ABC transporter ATP-binding protein [Burkholderiales bacterium]